MHKIQQSPEYMNIHSVTYTINVNQQVGNNIGGSLFSCHLFFVKAKSDQWFPFIWCKGCPTRRSQGSWLAFWLCRGGLCLCRRTTWTAAWIPRRSPAACSARPASLLARRSGEWSRSDCAAIGLGRHSTQSPCLQLLFPETEIKLQFTKSGKFLFDVK